MRPKHSTAEAFGEWFEAFMYESVGGFIQQMRQAGLSIPQTYTLMHLYHRGPCPVSDIGALLGVTNAAASQLVERLAQRGLVDRTESPEDRRVRRIELTSKSLALIRRTAQPRHRLLAEIVAALPRERQAVVHTAFAYLTEALSKVHNDRMPVR